MTTTGTGTGGVIDGTWCTIDGGIFAARSTNPNNSAECCNPSLSPNAWLPLFSRRFSFSVNGQTAPDGNHIAGINDGTVMDLNGDGKADVILTAYLQAPSGTLGESQAWVYLSSVDGGFDSPVVYPGENPYENWPGGVTVADLNLDGYPDLIVSTSSSLEVRLGDGNGTFGDEIETASQGANQPDCQGGYVRAADLNGDGWPDIAEVTWSCGMLAFVDAPTDPGTFSLNSGPVPQTSGALGIGDFNGDGRPDVAYDQGTSLAWLENGPGGITASGHPLDLFGIQSIASFPTTGGDALVATSGSTLTVFSPTATGPGQGTTYNLDTGGILAVADVNGDGLPDLLVGGGQTVDVLINLGNSTFSAPGALQLPVPQGSFIQRVGAGDLDGDEASDLVVFWGWGPWEGWVNSCGSGATAADLDGGSAQ